MKSYIQVYTGNGKGKTTASLGLALRALGAGKSVFIGQFLKNGNYSEIKMLDKIAPLLGPDQKLEVRQYGEPRLIKQKPRQEDRDAARKGWESLCDALSSEDYDLVIMEEINVAVHMDLISEEEVLHIMDTKPSGVELVLTGRYATVNIINAADLVSRIDDVKHYYRAGVKARIGIER